MESIESADERLAALEARVAALEARRDTAPAPPALDPDTFWALEGLHARVPAPGAVLVVGDVELPGGQTARWQEGATTEDLLDADWERAADVLAALGHPVRLQLVRHVLRGVDSARELAEIEGMGTSGQVYHHLRQLVAAGWLRNRGARYEVPPERVVPLLTTILGGRR
jgi:Helix-turn-helix domain